MDNDERILIPTDPDQEEMFYIENDPAEKINQSTTSNTTDKDITLMKKMLIETMKQAVDNRLRQRAKRTNFDNNMVNKLQALGYIGEH